MSCKSGHRFCDRFDNATAGAESPRGERLGAGKVRRGVRPGTQTYVGQLQSGLFLRAYFAYTASHIRLWPERRLLRDSNMSEFGGKAEVAGARSKRR